MPKTAMAAEANSIEFYRRTLDAAMAAGVGGGTSFEIGAAGEIIFVFYEMAEVLGVFVLTIKENRI